MSRVIARCSQDISAVDGQLANMLDWASYLGTNIFIKSVTVVTVAGWQMLLPALAIVTLGLTLGHVYITAQLPLKRLMSNAKAPILAHIQATLVGLGPCLLCETPPFSRVPL